MRILNSPEALKRFATPTAEGQRNRKPIVAFASVNDLTEAGHNFIMERFQNAIIGKTQAKVLGIDKLGSVDFVTLKLGDNEDFPFTIMMDIARDAENKPVQVRILNSSLPVEILKDFAKFLGQIAKEGKAVANASEEELQIAEEAIKKAEAPAKLDRCVADVMTKKLKKFRQDKGRGPTKKERQEMESSAFAICNAQLKKD
jgi:hypothetical protein